MVIKKLLDEFDESVIRLFVQKNADYYIAKWKVMASSESKISWNWAAFMFTATWMGYRKMFLYAFLYILINLTTLIPFIGFILWILLWVGMGLYGNYLYGKKTYETLVMLKTKYPEEDEFKRLVVKEGGTSIGGVVLVILMGIVLYAVLFAIGISAMNTSGYGEF